MISPAIDILLLVVFSFVGIMFFLLIGCTIVSIKESRREIRHYKKYMNTITLAKEGDFSGY